MTRLYYSDVNLRGRLRDVLPFLSLLALLTILAVNYNGWTHVRANTPARFYAYHVMPVPANVAVLGGFTVNYPPGGWLTVVHEPRPTLVVDAWVGPARLGVHIRSWRLLLDGNPLRPASEANFMSLDPVKQFDHLELYDAGWELVLPLSGPAPGVHTLALEATLEDGTSVIVQEARLV